MLAHVSADLIISSKNDIAEFDFLSKSARLIKACLICQVLLGSSCYLQSIRFNYEWCGLRRKSRKYRICQVDVLVLTMINVGNVHVSDMVPGKLLSPHACRTTVKASGSLYSSSVRTL